MVNQSAPSALGCIPWGLMVLSMTSLLKYSLNSFSYSNMSSLFQIFSLASAFMEFFWRLVLLVKAEVIKAFSISAVSMSSVSRVPAPFTHRTTFALIFLFETDILACWYCGSPSWVQTIPPCLWDSNKTIVPEMPTDP